MGEHKLSYFLYMPTYLHCPPQNTHKTTQKTDS